MSRPRQSAGSAARRVARNQYQPPVEADDDPPAGPPPWMQRARGRKRRRRIMLTTTTTGAGLSERGASAAPLRGPASPRLSRTTISAARSPRPISDADPSRYDDALYGQLDAGAAGRSTIRPIPTIPTPIRTATTRRRRTAPKRRGGMITVAVVLALAVVGTGGAFAYRTYVGSPRSGEPPIIKADTSPTKIVPAPADAAGKVPDRMATGDGTEKIVPREEAPVDVNANTKSGPRMVFPPLNQNANPPSAAQRCAERPAASRRRQWHACRTTSRARSRPSRFVATRPTAPRLRPRRRAAPRRRSRQPRAQPPRRRDPGRPRRQLPMLPPTRRCRCRRRPTRSRAAAARPGGDQRAGSRTAPAPPRRRRRISGAGLLAEERGRRAGVLPGPAGQVPGACWDRARRVIKRADLGDKGVYYRAMVGPFGSSDEASQLCGSLKTAGGQCVIQRN